MVLMDTFSDDIFQVFKIMLTFVVVKTIAIMFDWGKKFVSLLIVFVSLLINIYIYIYIYILTLREPNQ